MKKNKGQQHVRLDANRLLETMQRLLIERPKGWYNAAVRLNDNLVDYLRGHGPDVDWESYPIARNWFTQNNLFLSERLPNVE